MEARPLGEADGNVTPCHGLLYAPISNTRLQSIAYSPSNS